MRRKLIELERHDPWLDFRLNRGLENVEEMALSPEPLDNAHVNGRQ